MYMKTQNTMCLILMTLRLHIYNINYHETKNINMKFEYKCIAYSNLYFSNLLRLSIQNQNWINRQYE